MAKRIFALTVAFIFVCVSAFAMCGMCGSGAEGKKEAKNMFAHVADEAAVKDGVKEITYDQFMAIRKSSERYTLLDVLPADSYKEGHIDGAISFPLDAINKITAEKRLSRDDHIIVYCGSFKCTASTQAAKKLSGLGYSVLDYKGGLKDWQDKGNKRVSNF